MANEVSLIRQLLERFAIKVIHETSVSWPAFVRATQVTLTHRQRNFTVRSFKGPRQVQLGGPQSRAMTSEDVMPLGLQPLYSALLHHSLTRWSGAR
jgi:hypothetical protein